MPPVSLAFGGLLIALGAGFYFGTESASITALIPAFFGIGFAVLGVIGMMGDAARKHAMHVAAMLGLVGCLMPGYMAVKSLIKGMERPAATLEQGIMSLVCAVFVFLCVRSFIAARRARAARGE